MNFTRFRVANRAGYPLQAEEGRLLCPVVRHINSNGISPAGERAQRRLFKNYQSFVIIIQSKTGLSPDILRLELLRQGRRAAAQHHHVQHLHLPRSRHLRHGTVALLHLQRHPQL